MYLCYVDESGTPDIPGNTSHFILAGFSLPIWHWKNCDQEVSAIKKQFGLDESEIHTAWLLRRYLEQDRIRDFELLNYEQRKREILQSRNKELLRLQKSNNQKQYQQVK